PGTAPARAPGAPASGGAKPRSHPLEAKAPAAAPETRYTRVDKSPTKPPRPCEPNPGDRPAAPARQHPIDGEGAPAKAQSHQTNTGCGTPPAAGRYPDKSTQPPANTTANGA